MLKKRAISAKRRRGLGMKSPSRFGRQPNVPRMRSLKGKNRSGAEGDYYDSANDA